MLTVIPIYLKCLKCGHKYLHLSSSGGFILKPVRDFKGCPECGSKLAVPTLRK